MHDFSFISISKKFQPFIFFVGEWRSKRTCWRPDASAWKKRWHDRSQCCIGAQVCAEHVLHGVRVMAMATKKTFASSDAVAFLFLHEAWRKPPFPAHFSLRFRRRPPSTSTTVVTGSWRDRQPSRIFYFFICETLFFWGVLYNYIHSCRAPPLAPWRGSRPFTFALGSFHVNMFVLGSFSFWKFAKFCLINYFEKRNHDFHGNESTTKRIT